MARQFSVFSKEQRLGKLKPVGIGAKLKRWGLTATSKVGCSSNRHTRKFLSVLYALLLTTTGKRIVVGLAIIIPVSVISGITANALREHGLAFFPEYVWDHGIKRIDIHSGMMGQFRGLLIDARPNRLFKQCHIPEAFNFPPGKFDFFYGLYLSNTSKDVPIYICGRTYSQAFDEQLAQQLFLKGHKDITIVPFHLSCP
jgi:rhodanese-related sulfurtransferase